MYICIYIVCVAGCSWVCIIINSKCIGPYKGQYHIDIIFTIIITYIDILYIYVHMCTIEGGTRDIYIYIYIYR